MTHLCLFLSNVPGAITNWNSSSVKNTFEPLVQTCRNIIIDPYRTKNHCLHVADLLQKLTVTQMVKKFSAFYGTRMFTYRCHKDQLFDPILSQRIRPISRPWATFRTVINSLPNFKLEDLHLTAVRDCLFNVFTFRGRLLHSQLLIPNHLN
jgi:hypothetical protein